MKKRVCLPILTACCLTLPGADCSARNLDAAAVKANFLSESEVNALFGTLPRYLNLGSFLLNRLHNIPIPTIQDGYLLVSNGDGTYTKTRPAFSALERKLEDILSEQQGDWSIYIKDLKTQDVISINEHPMESASLIKLYIAGATLERLEQRTLTETDTIRNALKQMIVVSDNESANVLVRSFYQESEGKSFQDGLDIVNDFCDRYGFENTTQYNGLADPTYWVNPEHSNATSTADCAKMLEYIYDRELVSHYASYRFEDLLINQEVNYKIPSALPEGTPIAHKTGEISDTENDAAIIYTPYGDYIYCIMSTDLYDTGSAVDTIRSITKLVYNWFTSPVEIVDPSQEESSDLS